MLPRYHQLLAGASILGSDTHHLSEGTQDSAIYVMEFKRRQYYAAQFADLLRHQCQSLMGD